MTTENNSNSVGLRDLLNGISAHDLLCKRAQLGLNTYKATIKNLQGVVDEEKQATHRLADVILAIGVETKNDRLVGLAKSLGECLGSKKKMQSFISDHPEFVEIDISEILAKDGGRVRSLGSTDNSKLNWLVSKSPYVEIKRKEKIKPTKPEKVIIFNSFEDIMNQCPAVSKLFGDEGNLFWCISDGERLISHRNIYRLFRRTGDFSRDGGIESVFSLFVNKKHGLITRFLKQNQENKDAESFFTRKGKHNFLTESNARDLILFVGNEMVGNRKTLVFSDTFEGRPFVPERTKREKIKVGSFEELKTLYPVINELFTSESPDVWKDGNTERLVSISNMFGLFTLVDSVKEKYSANELNILSRTLFKGRMNGNNPITNFFGRNPQYKFEFMNGSTRNSQTFISESAAKDLLMFVAEWISNNKRTKVRFGEHYVVRKPLGPESGREKSLIPYISTFEEVLSLHPSVAELFSDKNRNLWVEKDGKKVIRSDHLLKLFTTDKLLDSRKNRKVVRGAIMRSNGILRRFFNGNNAYNFEQLNNLRFSKRYFAFPEDMTRDLLVFLTNEINHNKKIHIRYREDFIESSKHRRKEEMKKTPVSFEDVRSLFPTIDKLFRGEYLNTWEELNGLRMIGVRNLCNLFRTTKSSSELNEDIKPVYASIFGGGLKGNNIITRFLKENPMYRDGEDLVSPTGRHWYVSERMAGDFLAFVVDRLTSSKRLHLEFRNEPKFETPSVRCPRAETRRRVSGLGSRKKIIQKERETASTKNPPTVIKENGDGEIMSVTQEQLANHFLDGDGKKIFEYVKNKFPSNGVYYINKNIPAAERVLEAEGIYWAGEYAPRRYSIAKDVKRTDVNNILNLLCFRDGETEIPLGEGEKLKFYENVLKPVWRFAFGTDNIEGNVWCIGGKHFVEKGIYIYSIHLCSSILDNKDLNPKGISFSKSDKIRMIQMPS